MISFSLMQNHLCPFCTMCELFASIKLVALWFDDIIHNDVLNFENNYFSFVSRVHLQIYLVPSVRREGVCCWNILNKSPHLIMIILACTWYNPFVWKLDSAICLIHRSHFKVGLKFEGTKIFKSNQLLQSLIYLLKLLSVNVSLTCILSKMSLKLSIQYMLHVGC